VGVGSEKEWFVAFAVPFFPFTMMTVAAAENDLVPTAGHKEQPETGPPFCCLESAKLNELLQDKRAAPRFVVCL
jgi:hypothetical protein